ncbi:F-box domain-containing protein [Podospora fimiseda]|uniref:F-box domain-containing protein n=1 Tax=Podospora fimiseda TaxID=252190 RepID=A0AAN7GSJ3_9PEZI|nr:F-box domain-containing protein [Podospora fimiseda]
MDLNRMPTEVLSLILSHLPYPSSEYDEVEPEPLATARLVCRQWNELASQHLFRVITLEHGDNAENVQPDGEGDETDEETETDIFHQWNAQVDSDLVKRMAKIAMINSGPLHNMLEGRDYDDWACWEKDDWDEFKHAISRIKELPGIREVYIRFSEKCQGKETDESDWHWEDEEVEKGTTRLNTLRHVFVAMREHRERYGGTGGGGIKRLSIENLANNLLSEWVGSEGFKEGVKGIRELRLNVVQEYTEAGPDHDLDFAERVTFEPFLQGELLPRFNMEGLTILDLSFAGCWGVCPGTFDGKGLVFSNLKRLSLGNFVIAHDDHFDWVLRQTSLERLYFKCCFVADSLRISDEELNKWGVKTHDWVKLPEVGHGSRTQGYEYRGRWETVFDRIREELVNLMDFRFKYWHDYNTPVFDVPEWTDLFEDEERGYDGRRYVSFHSGMIPPWDGEDSGKEARAKEGDKRAFDELIKVTRERWGSSRR